MSFLTGFVTGFSQSVDTQLRESIDRTRDNIDMISKWRLKKAEEREAKRKERGKELDDMLSNAAYVISGDANNAQAIQMAGDLLKEQGEKAFLNTIADIDNKQRESGVNVMPFFTRGAEASTVQSSINPKSSLVNAFLDADTSIPTMTAFPTDLKPGGGLIARITGADPFAMGEARATDQMSQLGITLPSGEVKDTTGLFGKTTFDIEGYKYETMDINQKMAYLQQEELKPGITEDELKKIQVRKDNLFKVATANGDLDVQINMLQDRLNSIPSDDPQRGSIANQLKTARRQKKMNEAESDPDESIAIDLKATFALQDAVDEDGNITDAEMYMQGINLRRRATDMKDPITNAKKLERLIADHQFRQENVEGYSGSDNEKQALANIAQARLLVETAETFDSNDVTKELKNLEDMSSASIAAVVGRYKNSIDYDTLADGSVRIKMITSEDALNAVIGAYTKQYQNLKKIYQDQGLDTRALDAAFTAATGKIQSQITDQDAVVGGDQPAGGDQPSVVDSGTEDGAGISSALSQDAGTETTLQDIEAKTQAQKAFPNDEAGAKSFIATIQADDTLDELLTASEELHNPQFKQLVKSQIDTLSNRLSEFFVPQIGAGGETVMVVNPTMLNAAYGTVENIFPGASKETQNALINMAMDEINKEAVYSRSVMEADRDEADVDLTAKPKSEDVPAEEGKSTLAEIGDFLAKTGIMGRSMQYQTLLKDREAQASAQKIDYTSLSMKDLQDIIKDSSASTDQVLAATDEIIQRSKAQNKARGGLMRRV